MPTINHGAAVQGAGASFRSVATYTTGVYHLNERAIKKLDEQFKKNSYTDVAANLNNFSWANANAITIESEGRGLINAYDFGAALGSRMGALHEINDQQNTYRLKQVYSARETYEKIYSDDKLNERSLARVMKGLNEDLAVAVDTYRLKTWADGAGTTFLVPSSGTLGSTNVVRTLLTASAMLDNMNVPESGRVAFIGITDAIEFQLAAELAYSPEFIKKGAVLGEIRQLGRVKVIAVPDSRMPAGAKIIIKWKGASADPRKMNYTKIFPSVEGYTAPILNAVWRYDSFILAMKANGVLVIGDATAAPQATPTATVGTSTNAGKITFVSASADAIYYTIDGHNPKIVDNGSAVNLTAATGVATSALTADCYVQAYAVKAGKVASGIAKWKFDATANTLTALPYYEEVPV